MKVKSPTEKATNQRFSQLLISRLSFLMSLVISISIIACSNQPSTKFELKTTYDEFAYFSAKTLDVTNAQYVASVLIGDTIAILGEVYAYADDDSLSAEYTLFLFDFEGSLISATNLNMSLDPNETIIGLSSSSEGNIVIFTEAFGTDGNTISDITIQVTVRTMDATGNILGEPVLIQGKYGNTISNIFMDAEGYISVIVTGHVYVYDRVGELLYDIKSNKISGNAFLINGVVLIESYKTKNDGSFQDNYYPLDNMYREFGSPVDFTKPMASGLDYFGCRDGLFGVNEVGVYAYDFASENMNPVLRWSQSDFTFQYEQAQVCILSQNAIIVMNETGINLLVREETNPNEGKKIVEIGGVDLDQYPELATAAVAFNENSTDYLIEFRDYMKDLAVIDAGGDRSKAITQLNLDILSGEGPDILVSSFLLPTSAYESQGIFVDLYTKMDSDTSFHREDFAQNIFSICDTNGQLFKLGTKFTIWGLVGAKSVIGDRTGWTMDEFNAVIASLPDGVVPMNSGNTQTDILNFICACDMQSFVDYSTGEVNFDNDDFYRLLEFAKTYGLDDENPQYNRESPDVAVDVYFFSSLSAYNDEAFYLGGPVSVLGFPSENRSGASVGFPFQFSILSDSDAEDAAWIFIKSLLTEEAQMAASIDPEGFEAYIPIRTSVIEAKIESALDPTEEESEYFAYSGQYQTQPLTEETAKDFLDLINDIDSSLIADSDILSIIKEEAPAYFNDQKTAKDVAALIQNRVQTLVYEKR
jgi:hypothetical protein